MASDTMKPARPLTGKHVLAMFLAFFGVVIAVNMVMFRVATKSFSGIETDSAYRVGLAYNTELEAARQQAALGWAVDAKVDGDMRVQQCRVDAKINAIRHAIGRMIGDQQKRAVRWAHDIGPGFVSHARLLPVSRSFVTSIGLARTNKFPTELDMG